MFTFKGVEVVLGGVAVLRGVDLQVPGSGITVVVGPSGSGKSTLTRLCNRLIDPSRGVVRLWGRDLRDLDVLGLRRSVGMVFQRPTLFAGTVRENLAATGVADRQQHGDMLATVGLEPAILDQAARTLSGGEAQRVCLARALLMRPKALVADEPTASLDEPATLQLESMARTIAGAGVPVLWVTHDLAQFNRLADHGVVLADGRVAASGTAQALGRVPGGVARLVAAPWDLWAPHDLEPERDGAG